jgi:hypothetical protein
VRRARDGHGRIEKEIVAEKAAALGRAGERLEAALHEVREAAARLASRGRDADRGALTTAYEQARRRAQAARTALLIQREALGLRHHRVVDQVFPEPPTLDRLEPA